MVGELVIKVASRGEHRGECGADFTLRSTCIAKPGPPALSTRASIFPINLPVEIGQSDVDMASTAKSRWAEDEDESAEAVAQRKRDKEDKKRVKEEKLRKADSAQQANAQPHTQQPAVNGTLERPSKRLKLGDDAEQSAHDMAAGSPLLTFPTKRFGPCRSVEEYDRLNDIEEGSYGLVSRARQRATGTIVALKKLKMDHANDGFPVTGLREIQTLMASRHPHIVHLREVVMGSTLKE